MARLYWDYDDHDDAPWTTGELANRLEYDEGFLLTEEFVDARGYRSLFGAINNARLEGQHAAVYTPRYLSDMSTAMLAKWGVSEKESDNFNGNGKELCQEMARRLQAIP